jgi:hypothetical protein
MVKQKSSVKKSDQPLVDTLPKCPENQLEFQRMFPDEAACLKYLEKMCWPNGFICAECSAVGEPFRISTHPRKLKCRSCHHVESVTGGTVIHRGKTDLLVWFWAAYYMATQTPGISALEFQKKFGIKRYETAFQILHKLREAMVRPNLDKIGENWPLELDVIYVGGKTRKGVQGLTDQIPVILAVEICRKEIRNRKTKKITKHGLAGRVRLQRLPNKTADSVDKFVMNFIVQGATIVSADGTEFANLKRLGFDHQPVPMRGDREKMDKHLPMISRVTANLKTWIDGTFHGVGQKHLQAYLNEFMFRFNRRFYRSSSFRTLLGFGTLQVGRTYKEVYLGNSSNN